MDGLVEKACVAYNRVRKGGTVPQDTAMRAAIEAVFDALAEPSGEMLDAGGAVTSTANEARWKVLNRAEKEFHQDFAKEVWTAMLATLRKEALG